MTKEQKMKSKTLLASLLATGLVISGCSSAKEEKKENSVSNETSKEKDNSSSSNSESTFKDGKVSVENFDLTITNHKVIPVGAEGNKNGKKPIIVFWYDTTNKTGNKKLEPMTAWFSAFPGGATQNTDSLQVVLVPDTSLGSNQSVTVEKGHTVSSAIAYELNDSTTPVKIKAFKDSGTKELGSQEFSIK